MESKPTQAGLSRHALIMIACCVVPLALLVAVSVFNVSLGTIGYFAVLLMCPLMHLLMMRGMGHDHGHHAADGQSCHDVEQADEPRALPQAKEAAAATGVHDH